MANRKKSRKRTQPKKTSRVNKKPVGARKASALNRKYERQSKLTKKPKLSQALKVFKSLSVKERKSLIKQYTIEAKKSSARKRAVTRKKKLNLPPIAKSNIVKRKSKKGKTYYYNKRSHKFTSTKSWRQSRARVRASAEKITKIKAKKPRELTQYNKIQKILSNYTKANGKKLGKNFNKLASNIYKQNKNVDPKFIEQNIDQIFDDFSGVRPELPKEALRFEQTFPYYKAIEFLEDEMYDGIKLHINLSDSANGFFVNFDGFNDDFSEWYTDSGTFSHLRQNYNTSPTAMFNLQKGSDGSVAIYEISILGEGATPSDVTIPDTPIPDPVKGLALSSPEVGATEAPKISKAEKIKMGDKAEEKYSKRWTEYMEKHRQFGLTDEQIKSIPTERWRKEQARRGLNDVDYMVSLIDRGLSAKEAKEKINERIQKEIMKILKADMDAIDSFRKIGWSDEKIKQRMLLNIKK